MPRLRLLSVRVTHFVSRTSCHALRVTHFATLLTLLSIARGNLRPAPIEEIRSTLTPPSRLDGRPR